MKRTVLVAGGTGRVGSNVVNFLSRSHGVERIVFVGRNEAVGRTVENNTIISAALGGFYPQIEFRKLDLRDEGQTVELLKEIKPEIIINATAAISLFQYYERSRTSNLNVGVNQPGGSNVIKDLVILLPLMRAIKKTGIGNHIVNVANPDNNHYILSKMGLGPLIGAGTIDLTVHGIRQVMANRLGVPIHNINVEMVAHHALRHWPPTYSDVKVPYFARIYVGNKDITNDIDLDEVVYQGIEVSGVETGTAPNQTNAMMTAASAVKNVLAIFNNTSELRYSSGIEGMPGGAPVRLSRSGAEIVLPEGLSIEAAMEINMAGMRLEGIDQVKENGKIFFTEHLSKYLLETFNLNWTEINLKHVSELAEELVSAYKKL